MPDLPSIPPTRTLGSTGIEVGSIAYGCWRFAGTGVADASRKIGAALDAGLTLIDTADIYGFAGGPGDEGFGDAELLLGRVLHDAPEWRDRMVLATKAGIRPGVPYDQSAGYLAAACDASLRRLGVDHVDLYQIHRPDLLTSPAEVAGALDALIDAGKVRAIGVSNFTVAQHRALAAHLRAPIVTTQPEWHPLHQAPLVDGTLDLCGELGCTPLVWSPLAGGRLAGELGALDPDAARVAVVADRIAGEQARRSRGCAARVGRAPSVRRHSDRRVADARAHHVVRPCPRRPPQSPGVVRDPDRRARRAAAVTETPRRERSEVAWFSALCDDDYRWLGVEDPTLRSTFEHCSDIVTTAERAGFDNILLPSGYDLGIDSIAFAGGVATMTDRIRMLVAVRCGELWPPQLARQLATLDRMLDGRLTINIISSDLPGAPVPSEPRYARSREVMAILRTLLRGESLDHHGEHYDLSIEPPRVARDAADARGGEAPPFYFGGMSEPARETAAEHADVFLMWPDTIGSLRATIDDMTTRADAHGRTLRFGYRVHVVVRETESAARAAAFELVSRLEADTGDAIRQRSLDASSVGVARQADLRDRADADGFAEAHLWTGIGRARSGCGAAIVGDPDQVVAKLREYEALGISSFILSGYPHREECELVAQHVLPSLRG